MRRTLPTLAVLALVGLTACQKAETAEQMAARMQTESEAAKAAIETANASFMRHFAAGHFDSVATFYTADAVVMPSNAPAVTGHQAIVAAMTQGGAGDLRLTTLHVVANGPMAIEHGSYTFGMTPPGASAPISIAGKYVVYWKQTADGWKMQWDIWNEDAPMAMPAPPPARRRN